MDRNRHKNICYTRAQQGGVATARLPITQHFKLHTSAVSFWAGVKGGVSS